MGLRFPPGRLPARRRSLGGSLLRLALALLLATLTVGFAALGLFVSSAPEWLSLVLEPVSLLLVPGMVVALVTSGPHDFSPGAVVSYGMVFYAVFFYAALSWRSRRRRLGKTGV